MFQKHVEGNINTAVQAYTSMGISVNPVTANSPEILYDINISSFTFYIFEVARPIISTTVSNLN